MKLLKREADRAIFRMSAREKTLLERLVSFYPLDPTNVASLSRTGGDELLDAEALLNEALSDQRSELVAWVGKRLKAGEAFVNSGNHWRLVLSALDVEKLLQVLNELRLAAWRKLGSPDDLDSVRSETSVASAPLRALLMLTGQFQMVLLASEDARPSRASESERESGTD